MALWEPAPSCGAWTEAPGSGCGSLSCVLPAPCLYRDLLEEKKGFFPF